MSEKIVATCQNRVGAAVNLINSTGYCGWECTGCGASNPRVGSRTEIVREAQGHADACTFTAVS